MSLSKVLDTTVDPDGGVPPHQIKSDQRTVIARDFSISDRTKFILKGLTMVLRHHGCNDQVAKVATDQVTNYLCDGLGSADEVQWLARCKYVLTYPLAKYLKNELPPSPPCGPFRPQGIFRRWAKARLSVFSRKNTHLWYSWFQAKRCTLPLSHHVIEATYQKHLKALTSGCYLEETLRVRLFSNRHFMAVLDKVREDLQKFLPAGNFEDELKSFTSFRPSTNASFESNRKTGGQQSHLRWLCGLPVSLSLLPCDELVTMTRCPCSRKIVERRQCGGLDDWSDLQNIAERAFSSTGEPLNEVDALSMAGSLDFIQSDPVIGEYPGADVDNFPRPNDGKEHSLSRPVVVTGKWHESLLDAEIRGVIEPNKIRVISKGEALPYYAMKPLQVALHSILRRMDCFRLIGRKLCPTDIIDLVPELQKEIHEWNSIDYSAATDELNSRLSDLILSYLLQDYTIVKRIARAVLGPHALYYPVLKPDGTYGKAEFRGIQNVGQLMGSILSFPILCLANLGTYLLTIEDRPDSAKDSTRNVLRKVLVNGDDMLYAGRPGEFDKHVEIARGFGLNMSVGKAYHHPSYLNINSVSIHYDLQSSAESVTPWQIDFLNTGLFNGIRKVSGQTDDEAVLSADDMPFTPLMNDKEVRASIGDSRHYRLFVGAHSRTKCEGWVSNIPLLLKGSLPGSQRDVLDAYIREHRTDILKETQCFVRQNGKTHLRTRNLFLPEAVGGMGVTPPIGWRFAVSERQIQLAESCLDEMSRYGCSVSQSPLPGPVAPPLVESNLVAPWVPPPEIPTFPSFVLRKKEWGLSKGKLRRQFIGFLQTYRPYAQVRTDKSSACTPMTAYSGDLNCWLCGFPSLN